MSRRKPFKKCVNREMSEGLTKKQAIKTCKIKLKKGENAKSNQ